MKGKKSTDEKTHYQNYTYAFKLKIVRQIDNGLISYIMHIRNMEYIIQQLNLG